MDPQLERFLTEASRLKKRVILRSNLVILLEDAFRHFIDLYARLGIEVVGSLPDSRAGDLSTRQIKALFYWQVMIMACCADIFRP